MSAANSIRLATPQDGTACLAIYRPIVEESTVSFETEPPTLEAFEDRIAATTRIWPWLVAIAPSAAEPVVGYAYASEHRERSAYQWCVETSVYVAPDHHHTGLGQRLYEALFACLRAQGFVNAYAGVALPNDASVAFHRELGFHEVGVYDAIGYKSGSWHSVSWWQRRLSESIDLDPAPPRSLATCRPEIEALLVTNSDAGA